ncbi:MAG: hypothetical protein ACX93O_12140 [Flagellimonas sp.]
MGFKTIKVQKQVPRKTFVQGDFIGKYFGRLNKDQESFSVSKMYDISIYDGKIFHVVNSTVHTEVINENTYDRIDSEVQLEQHSFEDVVCFPNKDSHDYDGYRLHIHEPKLENVRIRDVVKEGKQTFGTLFCKVSGYLLDYTYEEEEIEIETCDDCDHPLEDCICNRELVEIPQFTPERPPQKSRPVKNFNDYTTGSSWGCWSIIGILAALFIIFSFGLPGIFFLLVIALLYLLGRSKIVSEILTWLAYIILALFFLVVVFSVVDTCANSSNRNRYNTADPKITQPVPERNPVIVEPKKEQKVQKPQPVYKKTEPVPVAPQPTVTTPSVYICNGRYAKRYHLSPYCRGLSNCKASVSSISRNDARSMGRTLCGYED